MSKIAQVVLRQWPLLGAITMLATLGAICMLPATKRNNDQWIYPLDDTYIHFAIAKTFAASAFGA